MAVLRWDPWGELAALQRDMSELMGRTATGTSTRGGGLVPAIDAYRDEDALVVRVELPGMRAEDVEVSVNEGLLTLAGERRLDEKVPEDAWVRRERPVGRFERSFNIPEGTDPSGISAAFEHGLLELRIPHPPERRPHRVQIGGGEQTGSETIDVSGEPQRAGSNS